MQKGKIVFVNEVAELLTGFAFPLMQSFIPFLGTFPFNIVAIPFVIYLVLIKWLVEDITWVKALISSVLVYIVSFAFGFALFILL